MRVNTRTPRAMAALTLVCFSVLAGADDAPETQARQLEIGKRIYREGVLSSGQPLEGKTLDNVSISGTAAACVNCHLRSGLGSTEGGNLVLPVTGTALFQSGLVVRVESSGSSPPDKALSRPAYTDESLAKAIRDGVTSSNRQLNTLMPRYALDTAEMRALITYLKSMSHKSSPGVDSRLVHFATVITPEADPAQRKVMLDLMEAYVSDRNIDPKQEMRSRQPLLPERYGPDREWQLHVWALQGTSETWAQQLNTFYRQQPVFAVLGGMGGGSWQPVHDFCARVEVACLFPNTPLPSLQADNYYSLYFSRGMTLEAEVLAKFLAANEKANRGHTTQVFRREPRAEQAATSLRRALIGQEKLRDIVIKPGEKADANFWSKLIKREKPDSLILWLEENDLSGLATAGKLPPTVYLSGTLLGNAGAMPNPFPGVSTRLISIWDDKQSRSAQFEWMRKWLESNEIPVTDEWVQGNTFWVLWLTAITLEHMGGNYSTEHLIEKIEHAVGSVPNSSLYPRVTLGPGQRFAAKGLYILELGTSKPASLVKQPIIP